MICKGNTMKNIIKTLVLCTITTSIYAAPTAKWAEDVETNKSSLITANINSPQANTNKQAVSYSYKLDESEKLNFEVKPFEENSKQYWIDSTGAKLLNGITLPITGGDTVIRISPLTNDKSVQLNSSMIKIKSNGLEKELKVFADSAQLKSTGASFSENTIALMVNADAGKISLKVDGFSDDTPFVVHVLEPNSEYALSLKTTKVTYNANQKITIDTKFLSGNNMINAELQGYISRPDGSVLGNLKFAQNNEGHYVADIDAIGSHGLVQGLWEVHVFAKSQDKGIEIMRDAQTSFAVNLNTAQFNGQLTVSDYNIKVGIEVGHEGRYEVRGVLMGTDANSLEIKPIAMTMSAAWLNVGDKSIDLKIDDKMIQESGLIAPFSIKNVQLSNQTYLAPVQTIKQGINLL